MHRVCEPHEGGSRGRRGLPHRHHELFARKSTEIRDRLASIKLQLEAVDRSHDENAELASKVFELSQMLLQQRLTADYDAKRRILEIVCLNCSLDGATLVAEMRKPFDVLAEGLFSENSRDDRTWLELFLAGLSGWNSVLRQHFPGKSDGDTQS